jgi:hypothetical protein
MHIPHAAQWNGAHAHVHMPHMHLRGYGFAVFSQPIMKLSAALELTVGLDIFPELEAILVQMFVHSSTKAFCLLETVRTTGKESGAFAPVHHVSVLQPGMLHGSDFVWAARHRPNRESEIQCYCIARVVE